MNDLNDQMILWNAEQSTIQESNRIGSNPRIGWIPAFQSTRQGAFFCVCALIAGRQTAIILLGMLLKSII